MALPLSSETLEFGVGGVPIVQSQGLNTLQASNLAGFTIDTSGNVAAPGTILSSAPTGGGIGYATGAGGAVTQATNRSTGVTINKLSGQITTNTTSLAALASAEFTVTNSTVAIGDVVLAVQQSGSSNVAGTAGVTDIVVVTVANGSFILSVQNDSSTTAETGAIIINFVVIKSVAA